MVAPPVPPLETVRVRAVRPDRDVCEIRLPKLAGYRVEFPNDRLKTEFTPDHVLEPTPERVGVTEVTQADSGTVRAVLNPYDPIGTTADVDFHTSKTQRHHTDPRRCHINWAILDSSWEGKFCQVVERHPKVLSYVKNHRLGFTVPYTQGPETRTYVPDFIVVIDDGRGPDNPLNLVVEIKGFRGEDGKDKKLTMESRWVPAVNNLGAFGRWAFAEFREVFSMGPDLNTVIRNRFHHVIRVALGDPEAMAAEALIRAGGSDPNAQAGPRKRPWG